MAEFKYDSCKECILTGEDARTYPVDVEKFCNECNGSEENMLRMWCLYTTELDDKMEEYLNERHKSRRG